MNPDDRSRLIHAINAGDRVALQRLFVEYYTPLHAHICKCFSFRDGAAFGPDDVLQDSYSAAYLKLGKCIFKNPAAFYGWLKQIATNRAIDLLKKRSVPKLAAAVDSQRTYATLLERLPSTKETPSRQLAREEAVAAMLSSLAFLSENQRTAIRLRFLEGMHTAEVARAMGKTPVAVQSLLRHGLTALRGHIGTITKQLILRS